MSPETALLQRLASDWSQRSLLLINPADGPADYSGLNIAGAVHDQFDLFQRWQTVQSDALPVWFATHVISESMPAFDCAVLFLPKGKARLQAQLQLLANTAPPGAEIILIGAIKSGIKSAGNLMSSHCDKVRKLDAARHCQALIGKLRPTNAGIESLYAQWKLTDKDFNATGDGLNVLDDLSITTLPGVFASGHLDAGSELLLHTLIAHRNSLPQSGTLLDYGCGCGVLTAVMHRLLPKLGVIAVDVDAWALAAAQRTLATMDQISIKPSACATDIDGKHALIISNPPFHRQFRQTVTITERFLQQLPQLLSRHGQCWVVANGFLPYESMLTKAGLSFEKVATTEEFKVLRIEHTAVNRKR